MKICLTFDPGKKWQGILEQRQVMRNLGCSKNSWKTGLKHGQRGKEAIRYKRWNGSAKIKAARDAAESHWGVRSNLMPLYKQRSSFSETFLVAACPGELVKCHNSKKAIKAKLIKYYDLEYTNYSTEMGSVHLPCPPVFFDTKSEKVYIEDIKKNPIFCNIEPMFLIHKFVNVVSPQQALRLRRQWNSFKATNPVAHNTDETSSARSSGTPSYHLRIWRRSSTEAFITKDTRCEHKIGQNIQVEMLPWEVKHLKLKCSSTCM